MSGESEIFEIFVEIVIQNGSRMIELIILLVDTILL